MKKTWRERIAAAKKRGRWTAKDKDDLYRFGTCLVGEQRRLHPEVVVYLPADDWHTIHPADFKLHWLGLEAGNCTPQRAEELLDLIEDRVLELKREA